MSEPSQDLLGHALTIWQQGGWAMWAIAAVGAMVFGTAFRVRSILREECGLGVREHEWKRWLQHPEQARGPVGELIARVTWSRKLNEAARLFEEARAARLGPLRRDLWLLKVGVGAAPLIGLLGTVIGMLTTFSGLAEGALGDRTMDQVAAGISQALVTTQAGLVVALPGLFAHHLVKRSVGRFEAFLAHVESVSMQALYERERARRRLRVARGLAKRTVLSSLAQAVS